MKESPEEMIKLLDQKIQQRKDRLVVDIVTEASITEQLIGDNHLYDVHRYSK